MVAVGLSRAVLDAELAKHRSALRFHCYQMLGSLSDAEDLVQDTYERAVASSTRFEGRSTVKTWLFKIATFACIDELRKRKRRKLVSKTKPNGPETETFDTVELDEWIEPYPDALLPDKKYGDVEAVTLAFVAALQRLSARQRAILILRDSLDWSAEQVANLLEMTTAAVHKALVRAREAMQEHRPGRPAKEDLATARAFAIAFQNRDVTALAKMLQRDVVVNMPPFELWMRGVDESLAFFARRIWANRNLVSTLTRANGRFAVAWHDGKNPFSVVVFEKIARKRVALIHAFVMPHVVPFFSGGAPAAG